MKIGLNQLKMKEMQKIIKNSTRIIFIISLSSLILLCVFSGPILELFGPKYLVANQAPNCYCGQLGNIVLTAFLKYNVYDNG